MKTLNRWLAVSVLFVLPQAARADIIEPLPGKTLPADSFLKSARGVNVEPAVQNQQPAFLVRVNLDRPDGIYEEGQLMEVSVESEKSGYLYLLYKQADGSEKCLFPNQYDSDNSITAGRKITLPTASTRFRLRIAPPLGDELLVALVTLKPLSGQAFGGKSLTRSAVTDINLDTLIAKGVQVELRDKPAAWAEHSVRVKTVARSQRNSKPAEQKRIGLFVGISDYADDRIPDLSICHTDAQVMAEVMKQVGRLDGIGLLVNQQATRKAIERAFEELKLKSKPGDEVFIYWSGHGASCADTNGDETDGRDEYLVTHDGNPADIANTMVLDDTLGRWVQALDGRKVCVILDACHSGGQATGKGLGARGGLKAADEPGSGIIRAAADLPSGTLDSLFKGPAATAADGLAGFGTTPTPADFLDSELGRIKDINQQDAVMLFSSASDQISAERRDGKLSVMTYCLVEKLLASSSLTLAQGYEHVRVEVPKYMKDHFPGREQTPQLIPEQAGQAVRLR